MVLERFLSASGGDVEFTSSTSDRFNLFHSFYRLKWNPGKSLLESYKCSNSNLEFHILYGFEHGHIGTAVLSVPESADSTTVEEFVRVAFMPEIIGQFTKTLAFVTLESANHLDAAMFIIEELVKEHGLERAPKWYFDHHMFIAPSDLPQLPVPEGYRVAPLKLEHIPYMADIWAQDLGQKSATDLHLAFMTSNIVDRPSLGVFVNDVETPVAWCICYSKGSLGSLHVNDEHRGKKLARILIRLMTKKVVDAHGILPHGSVHLNNKASAGLLTSEGWTRLPVNYSKMFVDPSYLPESR